MGRGLLVFISATSENKHFQGGCLRLFSCESCRNKKSSLRVTMARILFYCPMSFITFSISRCISCSLAVW